MCDPVKLLTLKEASEILNVNPEVLRRWLRSGRLQGIKVGSDWRIRQGDLASILRPAYQPSNVSNVATQGPKMCIKSPKWLEYSGLPKQLNDEIGPHAWPVLKTLIEMDFEREDSEDRSMPLDRADLSERTGYSTSVIDETLKSLAARRFINIEKQRRGGAECVEILTPLRTPRMILDIPFENGGIRNAPQEALENRCMRRYLECMNGNH